MTNATDTGNDSGEPNKAIEIRLRDSTDLTEQVESGGLEVPDQTKPAVELIKGIMTDALDSIAQSGSTDQVRGYANTAIGHTKLAVGLAVGSPELTLEGLAQKALGEAQKFIGEAKMTAEAEQAEGLRIDEIAQPPEVAALTSP